MPRYRDSAYVRLDNLSFIEKYDSMTFILYNNLTPEYQSRHSRGEVLGWYRNNAFSGLQTDSLGHYWGQRDARQT
jgi:hypothetical protein